MKRKRRRAWWLRFWCGVAVAAIAMAGVSVMVIKMEQRAISAQQEANRQGLLRLALWRMDSWLSPRLGREAARPYYEYMPYYANRDAYTKYYGRIEVGDVMSPSPLLTFQSEYFPLHFQVDAEGNFSSPQVPTGNALDLASYQLGLSADEITSRRESLGLIEQTLAPVDLAVACEIGLERAKLTLTQPDEISEIETRLQGKGAQFADDDVQTVFNWQDRSKRSATSNEVQQDALKQSAQQLVPMQQSGIEPQLDEQQRPVVDVGPLVPVWLSQDQMSGLSASQLFFIRRVSVDTGETFQGVAVDWQALRQAMVAQASDLLPDVDLEPRPETDVDAAQSVWMLATIPAVLRSDATLPYDASIITPARAMLALAWIGLLAACVAGGLTIRSTIDYAERRDRFASAVTHELRTPMTTFRMYSEMLADGMVDDPAQRDAYHQTLRDESIRFSTLIENMLSFARVEEGRMPPASDVLTPKALGERLRPGLERRTHQEDIPLILSAEGDDTCTVDADSIEQIVCNLVDNACKYGCGVDDPEIRVDICCSDGQLVTRVCDNGPGVSERMRERVFDPFDRGTVEPGTETPGVGIGLALSRGLARSMGGSLRIAPAARGLCVVLRVPVARDG